MRTVKHLLCILALAGSLGAADTPNRKIVKQEEPAYPEIAQKSNIHGTVKIKVYITPEGTVRRTEYIGGHPLLAEAALKAIKNWQYERNAAETTATVEVKF